MACAAVRPGRRPSWGEIRVRRRAPLLHALIVRCSSILGPTRIEIAELRLRVQLGELQERRNDSRSPVSKSGAHGRWTIASSRLVSRTRRIGGSNLQSRPVESLRNLLREQLGFFNSNFRVWVMCKKRANRRGDDCIHLVRINHFTALENANCFIGSAAASPEEQSGHRKPKNERMAATTTISPMR
jgi:hypothetical protein